MMHGDVGRDSSPPRWEGVAEGGEMKMRRGCGLKAMDYR